MDSKIDEVIVTDRPVFVSRGDETVFAIVSESSTNSTGVLVLPAGGYTFTPQRNRWGVTLAHRLAALGFPTVRFDWLGIGDSTGTVDTFSLNRPAIADAEAALSAFNADEIILFGQCYGARTALAMAGSLDSLAGVILVSPPVRDFARGEGTATKKAYELSAIEYLKEAADHFRPAMLLDRAELARIVHIAKTLARATVQKATAGLRSPDTTPWVSSDFLRQLRELVDSGIPTLLLYGSDENDFKEFTEAREGELGKIIDRSPSTFRLAVVPGSAHAMDRVDIQEIIINEVVEFLASIQ